MSGEVPLTFGNMLSVLPHVKSGRLRAIAVTSDKRSPSAPELPTISESGLPGYEADPWYGVLAPAGTPREVIARLHAELVKIMHHPDMREKLLIEGGVCKGVVAQQGEHDVRYLASAVVIADGGFQGNAALVKQYICAYPERLKQRGAGTGRGDGVGMAMAIGAKLVGMNGFFGHVMSRDAMTNDKLWPYPYGDSLATAGIVVGPAGERFADEGRGGVYLANAIARLADPFSATIIFDHAIWEGPARNGFIPANPHLPAVGGTLIQADNLDCWSRHWRT